ncbi:PRC-barrel domain-containing protein [Burkholderia sp. 9120]|uniref:PRC-barrel domain-containing protein n=1 Tax=Burkholderia sp. 9120 TaxID=1500897 RepID=UPI0009DF94EE|nr:PRC-barrel domain-containing protein [Burkholderia sp. 9120]
MKHSILASAFAASVCFGLLPSPAAAQSAKVTRASGSNTADARTSVAPAAKCLSDLRVFNSKIGRDGYWLGGSRYGYGYPVNTAGYGWYGYPDGDYPASTHVGLQNARPGYEIRALITSANILAQHGQEQSCESLLSTSRGIYKAYVAGLHADQRPLLDRHGWQERQIASAQPVTGQNVAFNSDQLLGTEVRNRQDEALGSVHDLVTSPQSGKIAYLVISRGGILGIDEKYVAVPWGDFAVTPNLGMLVLNSTVSAMDAAPQQKNDEFNAGGHFDQDSAKVDAYWKTSLSKAE